MWLASRAASRVGLRGPRAFLMAASGHHSAAGDGRARALCVRVGRRARCPETALARAYTTRMPTARAARTDVGVTTGAAVLIRRGRFDIPQPRPARWADGRYSDTPPSRAGWAYPALLRPATHGASTTGRPGPVDAKRMMTARSAPSVQRAWRLVKIPGPLGRTFRAPGAPSIDLGQRRFPCQAPGSSSSNHDRMQQGRGRSNAAPRGPRSRLDKRLPQICGAKAGKP